MYKCVSFKQFDRVIVIHQPELGEFLVDYPFVPTDMIRVGSEEPVVFYVQISNEKKIKQLYHQENLKLVEDEEQSIEQSSSNRFIEFIKSLFGKS